jgi:hypothetical protein
MSKDTHKTKDGRTVKKGLYYYMNKRKKAGTSRKGKGTVSDKALKRSAKTNESVKAGGMKADRVISGSRMRSPQKFRRDVEAGKYSKPSKDAAYYKSIGLTGSSVEIKR